MANWNAYINDYYYPENTQADAPEKILYLFIRDALCKNSNNKEISKPLDNNWTNIFQEVNIKTNKNIRKNFLTHYIIKLRQGTGASFPVPFHADIACYYKPIYKKSGRPMDNKGFSNKFLLLFMYKDGEINYRLIQKFWDTLKSDKGLNYIERYILEKIEEETDYPFELKSKELLESSIDINLDKFKCKYQPEIFQKDLDFVLDLNLSRVDKINWIQNLFYYHFSSFMLRIYKIIKEEEINFNNLDKVDHCSKCRGLDDCPFKGMINTQSNISGNTNRETKEIKQHYKIISNDIFINGYYRFIAFNQLVKTFKAIKSREPNNLKEISELYKDNKKEFIYKIKKRLNSDKYKLNELCDIQDYFADFDSKNIFSIVTELYKDYYELKATRTPNSATVQVFNKLAGDKMGCKYLRIQRRRGATNFFLLKSDFLTFITNIIVGKQNQMLLKNYWEQMRIRGFTYASQREKKYIEEQLALLGHLEKKSDAGESIFVKKTVEGVD